jgi:hypothetical protein
MERIVAAALMLGLLACSSVGGDCQSDCATGGIGGPAGAPGGSAGGAGGGVGGAGRTDFGFCGGRPELTVRADDPCTFDIGPPPTDDPSVRFGHVYVDGDAVPHDTAHANGWDFADATMMSFVIYGPVCQDLRAGLSLSVTATYDCLLP